MGEGKPGDGCRSGATGVRTTQPRAEKDRPANSYRGSPELVNDVQEIRTLLNAYMKRLGDKDVAAKVTKEWRVVAKVLDRVFFYLYCTTIIVSLCIIFPRPHS